MGWQNVINGDIRWLQWVKGNSFCIQCSFFILAFKAFLSTFSASLLFISKEIIGISFWQIGLLSCSLNLISYIWFCNLMPRIRMQFTNELFGQEFLFLGLPWWLRWLKKKKKKKKLLAMQETWIQSLGLGRFPGERNGYPLQYSCLENSMTVGKESDMTGWLTFHFISYS